MGGFRTFAEPRSGDKFAPPAVEFVESVTIRRADVARRLVLAENCLLFIDPSDKLLSIDAPRIRSWVAIVAIKSSYQRVFRQMRRNEIFDFRSCFSIYHYCQIGISHLLFKLLL
jgi:hypothetical protein